MDHVVRLFHPLHCLLPYLGILLRLLGLADGIDLRVQRGHQARLCTLVRS